MNINIEKLGPQLYDKESQKLRITTGEYLIRSLKHFNNEVRRLQDDIEYHTLLLAKANEKNAHATTKGKVEKSVQKCEDRIRESKSELILYQTIVSKVYRFLENLDELDRKSIIDLFINNKTYENVALERNMHKTTLLRHVKKELSKFY